MPGNYERKLSATNPHNPGYQSRPRLDEVSSRTARFDSRYLAWRRVNPNHVQAWDLDLVNSGNWPRQQAMDSCNLLQLYHHIEYFLADYQMRFAHYKDKSNVLMMPYLFIEPKAGWKLFDEDKSQEYVVKAALTSKDIEGNSTFDGRILLEGSSGPPEGSKLSWIDPYGENDGKSKLVKILHEEEVRSILESQDPGSGNMADVRSKGFTPTVGYRLIRHEPASIDGNAFGPAREIKSRVRMTVNDPDDSSLKQKIWGQRMDCILQFNCYSIGGKVADRLSVWLRNFFMMYTSALKLLGIQEMLYWATKSDREESRTTYDLSIRNVQYYFRLEEISVQIDSKIKSYTLAIQALKDGTPAPYYTSEMVATSAYPTDTSGDPLYGYPDIGDDY